MPGSKLISQSMWKKVRKTEMDGRTDWRTDGHCHGIMCPLFKRAYNKTSRNWLFLLYGGGLTIGHSSGIFGFKMEDHTAIIHSAASSPQCCSVELWAQYPYCCACLWLNKQETVLASAWWYYDVGTLVFLCEDNPMVTSRVSKRIVRCVANIKNSKQTTKRSVFLAIQSS